MFHDGGANDGRSAGSSSQSVVSVVHRRILNDHITACLAAGLSMGGAGEATVLLGSGAGRGKRGIAGGSGVQGSYVLGPCSGLDFGDQMLLSRYLLMRICELHGMCCSLQEEDETSGGSCDGAGGWQAGLRCAIHFSTVGMRGDSIGNGAAEVVTEGEADAAGSSLGLIKAALSALKSRHDETLGAYYDSGKCGKDGKDTLPDLPFTSGIADGTVAVCIPLLVARECRGCLEDRRPPAHANPYLVSAEIVKAVVR